MGELLGAAGVGEKAEMTNAPKALGQDVHEEAAHELVGVEGHRLGFVVGTIIFPPKAHDAVSHASSRPLAMATRCV